MGFLCRAWWVERYEFKLFCLIMFNHLFNFQLVNRFSFSCAQPQTLTCLKWAMVACLKRSTALTSASGHLPKYSTFFMLKQLLGCTVLNNLVTANTVCLVQAPLLIGCDVRSMSPQTKAVLSNWEVIAVNQGKTYFPYFWK
jgi:hypothetical protein